GVTAGTYSKVTVDAKGRVTTGANIASSDVTTALGFTPLNKAGDVLTGLLGLNGVTSDPAGLNAGDKGKVWFRTDTNEIKYWNGSAAVALGVSGAGLTSLGGQTGNAQTFAVGTSGTAPNWSSATDTHTFNIPMANTATVTAGLISKAEYDTFNTKLGASLTSTQIFVGNTSNVATGVALSGDATISNAGALIIANNAVTSAKINNLAVTDAKINDVGVDKITSGASKYFSYKPNNTACADTQILSWDNVNSRWVCANDANSGGTVTSITAGTGLTGGAITGSGTIGLGTELTGVNGLSTTGFVQRTGAGAYSTASASTTASNSTLVQRDGSGVSNFYGVGVTGATSGSVTLRAPATVTSYSVTWPSGVAGAANSVLASDTSGNLSWINLGSVTGTINLTSQVTGVLPIANGGTNSSTALTSNQLMFSNAGAIKELGAMTDGQIVVGKSAASPQIVSMSGDVSILNTGATTVGKINGTTVTGVGLASNNLLQNTSGGAISSNNVLVSNGTGTGVTALSTPVSGVLTSTGGSVPTWSSISADTFTQYALLAGRSGGQTMYGGTAASNNLTLDSTSHATKGYTLINPSGGNVGIGTTSPSAALDVNGQMRTSSANAGAPASNALTVNWASGNVQYTSGDCSGPTTYTFQNMLDGGVYTLAMTGTGGGTCSFTGGSLTYNFPSSGSAVTSGKKAVFTFLRAGTDVFITWTEY
ncbi:MAG: beta strand repeat-containing protein, partial [Pseudobdellovibrionaceae bacterium]